VRTPWADPMVGNGGERFDQPQPPVPLNLANVSAGYTADVAIVRDVDLQVALREIVCVTGPNGSGKSTLLRAILGQAKVLGGSITIDAANVVGMAPERIARLGVGYVPQHRDVFGPMTVTENLEMGGYGLPRREVGARMDEVMEIVPRLRDLRPRIANRLSGGERKMVAIGRVLMSAPQLLILDEPTAGLSPQATEAFVEEQLAILPGLDRAVLIVEQKALALRPVADRALILVAGSVRRSGSGAEILDDETLADAYLM
jgi:branched-chain amino acid transport system ATP-binding protein